MKLSTGSQKLKIRTYVNPPVDPPLFFLLFFSRFVAQPALAEFPFLLGVRFESEDSSARSFDRAFHWCVALCSGAEGKHSLPGRRKKKTGLAATTQRLGKNLLFRLLLLWLFWLLSLSLSLLSWVCHGVLVFREISDGCGLCRSLFLLRSRLSRSRPVGVVVDTARNFLEFCVGVYYRVVAGLFFRATAESRSRPVVGGVLLTP